MNLLIDEEIDGAVRKALEKFYPYGFDDELYATIYVDVITALHNKDDIKNKYGYAYIVAKNLIKAILTNSVITAIKD